MRIVALLTVRDEELYLGRCLEHLISQGIEACVIDNESSDATRTIAETFLGRGVCRIETLPFTGHFDLVAQCRQQEELSREMDADWFIHHDADEIREAPLPYKTLREGIEAVDRAGYNAINFDEFVFLPESETHACEGMDYVEEMRRYYYFAPQPHHRINAWKKTSDINLSDSGGHQAAFENRRVFPINFILRHYIILSMNHAHKKYSTDRVYSREEIEQRGWHGWRGRFRREMVKLPPHSELKVYLGDRAWDCSNLKTHHLFIHEAP